MRGFGSTQPTIAMESILDRLAEETGIDPIEIRKINGLDIGKKTITGHVIDYGTGYLDALDAVKKAVESDTLPAPSAPNKVIGIGYAGSMKNVGLGSGAHDAAWAQMKLGDDGKIIVMIGAVEFGQGCDTVMAQIAAETLGVSLKNIEMAPIDTEYSLDGGITTASRQTFVSGNAVRTVGSIFKEKLIELASQYEALPVGYLDCDSDGVFDIRKENEKNFRMSFAELAKYAKDKGITLHEKYLYVAPETSPLKECSDNPGNEVVAHRLHFSYCFGVQAVVIEVDKDTGKVEVLRVYAAYDTGRAINPALVEGQIEGGIAMGIGYALSEKFEMKDGYVVTKQLKDMGIPRATDVPTDIRINIIEDNHPYGPFGAKGMGEIPLNATAPAILNAIHDAVGIRINALPVQADKLLASMKNG